MIFTVINGYIFINRNNGYNYIESLDYNDLYGLKNQFSITNIEIKNDSAIVSFTYSENDDKWLINADSIKYECDRKLPQIHLINGKHNYSLENLNSKEKILFTADYSSFSNSDSSKKNLYILKANLPLKVCSCYSLEDWKFKSKFSTKEETEKIKKILEDSVKVFNNDKTLNKIEKICFFLIKKLSGKKGTPDISMKSLSPYMQYKMAIDGKSKIWCENFSEIYLEFANTAGIPSRYVASNLKIGEKNYGGHVFTESYINEQGRWAYIDLSSSKVFTLNSDSFVVNSVDIYNIVSSGGKSNFNSLVYDSGRLVFKPFDSICSTEDYYFKNNSDLIYLFSEYDKGTFLSKLSNYFYPKTYYALYAGVSAQNNLKFYVKQIFLYFWILSVITLIASLVFLRKK